ncbi:hypothetical protein [Beggiatoa alba]|uniref:hypothetical protein n=1 Tax=Beggiatoa alba TaxID=1022 RepID=UPI0002DC6538|nr:hypothetical protein [Beggiatoa alba]
METPPSRKKPIASGQTFTIELIKKEEQTQEVKVTQNLFKQWKREAKQGNAKAQFNLGVYYEKVANQGYVQTQHAVKADYTQKEKNDSAE